MGSFKGPSEQAADNVRKLNSAFDSIVDSQNSFKEAMQGIKAVLDDTSMSAAKQREEISKLGAAYGVTVSAADVLNGSYASLLASMQRVSYSRMVADQEAMQKNLDQQKAALDSAKLYTTFLYDDEFNTGADIIEGAQKLWRSKDVSDVLTSLYGGTKNTVYNHQWEDDFGDDVLVTVDNDGASGFSMTAINPFIDYLTEQGLVLPVGSRSNRVWDTAGEELTKTNYFENPEDPFGVGILTTRELSLKQDYYRGLVPVYDAITQTYQLIQKSQMEDSEAYDNEYTKVAQAMWETAWTNFNDRDMYSKIYGDADLRQLYTELVPQMQKYGYTMDLGGSMVAYTDKVDNSGLLELTKSWLSNDRYSGNQWVQKLNEQLTDHYSELQTANETYQANLLQGTKTDILAHIFNPNDDYKFNVYEDTFTVQDLHSVIAPMEGINFDSLTEAFTYIGGLSEHAAEVALEAQSIVDVGRNLRKAGRTGYTNEIATINSDEVETEWIEFTDEQIYDAIIAAIGSGKYTIDEIISIRPSAVSFDVTPDNIKLNIDPKALQALQREKLAETYKTQIAGAESLKTSLKEDTIGVEDYKTLSESSAFKGMDDTTKQAHISRLATMNQEAREEYLNTLIADTQRDALALNAQLKTDYLEQQKDNNAAKEQFLAKNGKNLK